MKLGFRIFILYALIFSFCFYYPINWTLTNLRFRYLEGVEDLLVDQANILAAIIGNDMEAGLFDPEALYKAFESAYFRKLNARIYQFDKNSVDVRVYATRQWRAGSFSIQRTAAVLVRIIPSGEIVRLTLDGGIRCPGNPAGSGRFHIFRSICGGTNHCTWRNCGCPDRRKTSHGHQHLPGERKTQDFQNRINCRNHRHCSQLFSCHMS